MPFVQHALVQHLQTVNPVKSMQLTMVTAVLATVDTSLIISQHLANHVTQPVLLAANLHLYALPANRMRHSLLQPQLADATMDTSGIAHCLLVLNAMTNARHAQHLPLIVSLAEPIQFSSHQPIPANA